VDNVIEQEEARQAELTKEYRRERFRSDLENMNTALAAARPPYAADVNTLQRIAVLVGGLSDNALTASTVEKIRGGPSGAQVANNVRLNVLLPDVLAGAAQRLERIIKERDAARAELIRRKGELEDALEELQ
jgi:hypothetical protein